MGFVRDWGLHGWTRDHWILWNRLHLLASITKAHLKHRVIKKNNKKNFELNLYQYAVQNFPHLSRAKKKPDSLSTRYGNLTSRQVVKGAEKGTYDATQGLVMLRLKHPWLSVSWISVRVHVPDTSVTNQSEWSESQINLCLE